MSDAAQSEARKALNRLRRALEKAVRELGTLEGSLRHAEGDDFPAAQYDLQRSRLTGVMDFADEEAHRLQEKILHSGGLEPGRIRRSS
jgi:hypothetical protein